jgi:hypothetical protein
MEVTGEFQAPAAIPPAVYDTHGIKVGWPPETDSIRWLEETNLGIVLLGVH